MNKEETRRFRRTLRKWIRRDVRIPVEIEILLRNGRIFTRGAGIIRNISLKGALLGRMVLKRQYLPAEWFRLRIRFKSPEYRGIGALCLPVRFGSNPEFELAVQFDDFWARTDETKKHTRRTKRKKKKK